MPETVFAVEVLEPFISKWMFIELSHASRIVGREKFWVFNVAKECERQLLGKIASRVECKSIAAFIEELSQSFSVVVLDPSAEVDLSPQDFKGRVLVVVGGIMGDHPPRGRTKRDLTDRLGEVPLKRRIGPGQFTIDGAIYVAYKVSKGVPLELIAVQRGLYLSDRGVEVHLPYTYPVENGRVVVSEEEVKYILGELEEDEARAIREGVLPSIC